MEICPYKQLHASTWYFLAWSTPEAAHAAIALAWSVQLAREAAEGPALGTEFCVYTDNDFCLAANQWGYSGFLIDQGEIAQATSLVTDSLQRFRRHGNQPFIGDCLGTLGILALLRGDITESHTYLQEVVTIGTIHSLPVALAYWQPLLGIVTLYDGNASQARRLLEESLRLCLEMKNTNYLARVCMCLAETALWEGDLDQTEHWLRQSLAYQTSLQRMTIDELQWLFVAARLANIQGQYWRAATLLGLADAEHRRIHYVYVGPMLPLVNAALSNVRAALGGELFDEAFAAGHQLSIRRLLPSWHQHMLET